MSLDNRSISSNSFVYWSSLISGGVAGLVVDIVLFPIDTIKTRLQSERGFVRSGGFQVAVCGAIAGGIAAGLTTPLDVAKTRIMLADEHTANRSSVSTILRGILRERGIKGMFAGFVPRVLWITLGGAFFFGFYDLTSRLLNSDESI
ncbi:S-adenosylmethionine mitochondrial carrier protein homolog isoform X3 [Wyeomyia smithii]|uniref:S-adenosylmethionine mitochondrial carrier protein homolog isoform X3 n=1 Tax=Wyeomyia smithii TaxID=174621 RepID=UPI002467BC08|nr:S-adenosylmethionine mitochondrial carrier protein homolog isoform X3 [Wyeomyia smithii]